MLTRLTDHFEDRQVHGRHLSEDEEGTRRAAKGTVGLRLRVTRFDARAKLSQNKSPEVRDNITARFAETNTALAAEMRRVGGEASGSVSTDERRVER